MCFISKFKVCYNVYNTTVSSSRRCFNKYSRLIKESRMGEARWMRWVEIDFQETKRGRQHVNATHNRIIIRTKVAGRPSRVVAAMSGSFITEPVSVGDFSHTIQKGESAPLAPFAVARRCLSGRQLSPKHYSEWWWTRTGRVRWD